jgi:hypothetical protein
VKSIDQAREAGGPPVLLLCAEEAWRTTLSQEIREYGHQLLAAEDQGAAELMLGAGVCADVIAIAIDPAGSLGPAQALVLLERCAAEVLYVVLPPSDPPCAVVDLPQQANVVTPPLTAARLGAAIDRALASARSRPGVARLRVCEDALAST